MRLTRTRAFLLFKNAVKRAVPGRFAWPGPIDDSATMEDAPAVLMDWPASVRKPVVGLVQDVDVYPYWTKFRRFLEANNIDFSLYDIHRSTWLADAEQFDVVVWRPLSFPYELEECRRKIYVLERHLGKICYPSFDEALLYEDKVLQNYVLRQHDLPVIDTFISNSEEEARHHLAGRAYPAVWKVSTGSGSLGVELVPRASVATRWVANVFSFAGRRTYWPYVAQKNYVLVQPLEPNLGFDIRVIVIGDKVLGYYRDVPKGEFRASGMGTVRKERLLPSAVAVAKRVAEALDVPCIAVDCLVNPEGDRVLIIELSSFVQIETPQQLLVDGEAGMLVGDDLRFVPGKVWVQELALERFLTTRWIGRAEPNAGA
jgi:glutathione synthase/RimK-type ligase-like ATP-grasp enzyme